MGSITYAWKHAHALYELHANSSPLASYSSQPPSYAFVSLHGNNLSVSSFWEPTLSSLFASSSSHPYSLPSSAHPQTPPHVVDRASVCATDAYSRPACTCAGSSSTSACMHNRCAPACDTQARHVCGRAWCMPCLQHVCQRAGTHVHTRTRTRTTWTHRHKHGVHTQTCARDMALSGLSWSELKLLYFHICVPFSRCFEIHLNSFTFKWKHFKWGILLTLSIN